MPTQFLRDHALTLTPTRPGRWGADMAVFEAERDQENPKSFAHVEQPRPPIYLTAAKPSDVAGEAKAIVQTSLEAATGRRTKRTAQAIVSRVMSYPVSVADLGGPDVVERELRAGLEKRPMESPECRKLLSWVVASAKWSKGNLGAAGSILIHADESHPHLHHLVPIRRRADNPDVADLSFWGPSAAEARVRGEAREAGLPRQGKDMIAAGKAARRAILEDYNTAVGSRFEHAVRSDDPRKRRKRREHLVMRDQERELAATKELLADREVELAMVKVALEREKEETSRLRDKLRAVLDRARTWFGALRGEPAAVREIGEAPTVSQGKIDGALGVSAADVQRRRVAAI